MAVSQRNTTGFTLIELLLAVAIVGILASIAVSAYQTYTVRAQVSEAINFASAAKGPIVDAFMNNSMPPAGRADAGMSPSPSDASGTYVSQVDVKNGQIEITLGNSAHPDIQGRKVYLTPYVTAGNAVVWRCGNSPQPASILMAGGGQSAEYVPSTVDPRYLPSGCR